MGRLERDEGMRQSNDSAPADPAAGAAPDQAALLRAVAQQRDIAAYETLFRHFAPRLQSYMARLGDSQQAEELVQETMIAVWNKAAQFDPDRGAVSTWVFTIARNLRTDAFRRGARPEFDPEDPAFVPAAPASPDAALAARQAERRVHAALAELPEEQLALLRLSFFDDSSHGAIAERLGLPLGTVKSRLRLAFTKLRRSLAEPDDQP